MNYQHAYIRQVQEIIAPVYMVLYLFILTSHQAVWKQTLCSISHVVKLMKDHVKLYRINTLTWSLITVINNELDYLFDDYLVFFLFLGKMGRIQFRQFYIHPLEHFTEAKCFLFNLFPSKVCTVQQK